GFPNTNVLCEGTVIQFDLTIMNTGLPAPSTDNHVTISWYVNINGVVTPLTGPGYDNQTNILYPETGTMTLTAGYIFFYAVVGNCACPSGQAGVWIIVEAQPICGTIKPADQNPLIPASTPGH
ncbi:hypothetical protein RZS08_04300, partial [Arthrospira platensis SPKY1]|nr:hypothetical protein [Arthrospira platensis SPKY1]